jgi:DNA-directed RNA polymerase specialized sigma24 family protein
MVTAPPEDNNSSDSFYQLLIRWKQGDMAARERIFERLWNEGLVCIPNSWQLAGKHEDSEDVIISVLRRLTKKMMSDPDRFSDLEGIQSWIKETMKNRLSETRKGNKKIIKLEGLQQGEEGVPDVPSPNDEALNKRIFEEIIDDLFSKIDKQLTPQKAEQTKQFFLMRIEGKKFGEIKEITGWSRNTIEILREKLVEIGRQIR